MKRFMLIMDLLWRTSIMLLAVWKLNIFGYIAEKLQLDGLMKIQQGMNDIFFYPAVPAIAVALLLLVPVLNIFISYSKNVEKELLEKYDAEKAEIKSRIDTFEKAIEGLNEAIVENSHSTRQITDEINLEIYSLKLDWVHKLNNIVEETERIIRMGNTILDISQNLKPSDTSKALIEVLEKLERITCKAEIHIVTLRKEVYKDADFVFPFSAYAKNQGSEK